MNEASYPKQKWIYVVDKNFNVIYTNDGLYEFKNKSNIEKKCYKTICKSNQQCKKCPIRDESLGKTIIFNEIHKKWVSVSSVLLELPNVGSCYLITSEVLEHIDAQNAYSTNGIGEYSELLELNYKNDTCHIIYSNRYVGDNKKVIECSIKQSVISLGEKLVVAEDRQRFYDFWQLNHVGKEGIPKALLTQHHVEFRILNEDGNVKWVQQLFIPTQRSAENSIYVMNIYNYIDVSSVLNQTFIHFDDYGCYSYQQFIEHVNDFLVQQQKVSEWCILAIDIENFKLFNEWYGIEDGNQVLASLGHCLKEFQNRFGIAGYFGDDDFAYFMKYDGTMIEKLYQLIETQLRNHSGKMKLLPCIGVNKITNRKDSLIQVYDRAKLACSDVKGNYVSRIKLFDFEMLQTLQSELLLLSDIQEAFQNKEFYFVLQPKCNMRNGNIVGAEALARWRNSDNEEISPGIFVPFLEKSGLITELDMYIWESVCRWQHSMLERNRVSVPVSVNISRMDLFLLDVPSHFKQLIEKYHLDPRYIELEITESAYAENIETITNVVDQLRKMGFKVLMDDFGSAYSSLNMLTNLTMDVIKMDMRFLHWKNETSSKSFDILQTICKMSHMLGLDIIAEGVETEEQKNILLQNGCYLAQGYYFYRPLSVFDFEKEINEKPSLVSESFTEEPEELFYLHDLINKNMLAQDMINNMLGAVAFYDVVDTTVKLVRYNRKYVELLGDTDYPFASKIVFDSNFYQEGENDKIIKLFHDAQQNRHNGAEEDICRRKEDGSEMWLHLRVFFLYQRNGHSVFYSTVRDITEVYQMNKALQFLNNDMPGGYFRHLNNADGDFTHISQRFLDIFGYTRAEIKELFDDKFINMVHPDDRSFVIHRQEAMNKMGGNYSQPSRMRSKSGYITVLDQSRILNYEDREIVQGIILCDFDHYLLNDDCKYDETDSMATSLMPCGIYRSEADDEHRFSYVSNSMLKMLGYSRKNFEQKFRNTDNMVYIEDRERVEQEIHEQIQQSHYASAVFRIELPDGSLKWVHSIGRMSTDSQGKRWFYSCLTDYDYLKEKYEIKEWQLLKYRSLVEMPGALVYDYDPFFDRLTIEMTTENKEKETVALDHYREKARIQSVIDQDYIDVQTQIFNRILHTPQHGVSEFKAQFSKHLGFRWYRFYYTSLADENGQVYRVIGRGEDITSEKSSMYLLQEKAMKDSLTGLLNFESFKETVNMYIKHKKTGTLVLIDIDDFKKINDIKGHLVGDEVLKQLTKFFKTFFDEENLLSRFGGDEFLVYLPGKINQEEVGQKMKECLKQIAQLSLFDNIQLSCSIGISKVVDSLTFDEIFTKTDQALYQSKNKGKNTITFL